MVPRTFLLFIQACVNWVLIIFGTQVIKRKRPVRPVFPDYLSLSYDCFSEHLCLVYFRFQHRSKDILREKKLRYHVSRLLIDSRSFPQSSIYKRMWHLQENSSILIKQTFKQIKLLEYYMKDGAGQDFLKTIKFQCSCSAEHLQKPSCIMEFILVALSNVELQIGRNIYIKVGIYFQ